MCSETSQTRLRGEEELTRDFLPIGFREGGEYVVGGTSAIGCNCPGECGLGGIEALDGVAHPAGDEAFRDQIPAGVFLIGDMDGEEPALAVGVLAQGGGIVEKLCIYFHDFAFGGGDHLGLDAVAMEGEDLLALADPGAGFGELDFLDLAEQGGGELV